VRHASETDAYQDWQATHITLPRVKRRVRLYPHALHASETVRTVHRRAAEREFVLLEGLHHAGILKAEVFIEHERGPALIFEHDPEAERLDLFLRNRGGNWISTYVLHWYGRSPKPSDMPTSTASITRRSAPSGHAALFMAVAGVDIKSGAYTLAQRLRLEGRLSLDLLQRFGEELLIVADWLEQKGVSHGDIKPDNIGVGRTPSGRLTLIPFDFSLANTPVDNIRAGTPPYLDPFIRRRQPPRWDLYAERFAIAMTPYEAAGSRD
jgi:serine/threonine protein kinase